MTVSASNRDAEARQFAQTCNREKAFGQDPKADWQRSATLRKHWNGDRIAFMAFSAMQQRDGETYLIPV